MTADVQRASVTNLNYRGGPGSLSGMERGQCGTAVPVVQRFDGAYYIVLYRKERAKIPPGAAYGDWMSETYLAYEAKEEVTRIALPDVTDIGVADAVLTLLVRDYGLQTHNASQPVPLRAWQPHWPVRATVIAQASALVGLLRANVDTAR